MTELDKLSLGCGNDKPDGYFGIDISQDSDADITHDLTDTPWPPDDDQFHVIEAVNLFEHFSEDELDDIMREIQRVADTDAGCRLDVVVPHPRSDNADTADHCQRFSKVGFDVYCVDHDYPTPKPQVLRKVSVEYRWRQNSLVKLLRVVLPDLWVERHIPNTVDEIAFSFEVVDQ